MGHLKTEKLLPLQTLNQVSFYTNGTAFYGATLGGDMGARRMDESAELLKMLGDWQSRHSDVENAVVKRRCAKCMKAR